VTWHGAAWQSKEQLAPVSHVQLPLAQVPLHEEPEPQFTWHGGLAHEKLHDAFAGHEQVPFEQSSFE
jgi:hypothetical protein